MQGGAPSPEPSLPCRSAAPPNLRRRRCFAPKCGRCGSCRGRSGRPVRGHHQEAEAEAVRAFPRTNTPESEAARPPGRINATAVAGPEPAGPVEEAQQAVPHAAGAGLCAGPSSPPAALPTPTTTACWPGPVLARAALCLAPPPSLSCPATGSPPPSMVCLQHHHPLSLGPLLPTCTCWADQPPPPSNSRDAGGVPRPRPSATYVSGLQVYASTRDAACKAGNAALNTDRKCGTKLEMSPPFSILCRDHLSHRMLHAALASEMHMCVWKGK